MKKIHSSYYKITTIFPSILDENATLNDGLGEGVSYRFFVFWTFSERCYQSSIINYQSSDYQKGRI